MYSRHIHICIIDNQAAICKPHIWLQCQLPWPGLLKANFGQNHRLQRGLQVGSWTFWQNLFLIFQQIKKKIDTYPPFFSHFKKLLVCFTLYIYTYISANNFQVVQISTIMYHPHCYHSGPIPSQNAKQPTAVVAVTVAFTMFQ